MMLLFDDNKVKKARKPGKKQKGNPVGCTGKVKDEKEKREGNMALRRAIGGKWKTFLRKSDEISFFM